MIRDRREAGRAKFGLADSIGFEAANWLRRSGHNIRPTNGLQLPAYHPIRAVMLSGDASALPPWATIWGVRREDPTLLGGCHATVFAALPGWARLPCLIAIDGGLRREEIALPTVRNVDLSRRTILVRRSKNGKPREVGMTLRLRDALTTHLVAHPKGVEALCLTYDGVPLRTYSLTSVMSQTVKRIGMEGFRPHDLRHMHGTRLAERGVPPADIKAALGHPTLFSTLRYIDHAAPCSHSHSGIFPRPRLRCPFASAFSANPRPHPTSP